ncbi:hypothetical protein [Streptomyces sp. AK08-01B]|uniref:hypothetical protein n=1 Tax=unclassified Streptomyces TaxID=2593676 RepID=UPI0039F47FE3
MATVWRLLKRHGWSWQAPPTGPSIATNTRRRYGRRSCGRRQRARDGVWGLGPARKRPCHSSERGRSRRRSSVAALCYYRQARGVG